MKISIQLLGFFLAVLLTAGSAWSQKKPRYVIFFVHGLAGNGTTFGAMTKLLPEHLQQVNPKYNFETQIVTYDTGSNTKDAFDFVEAINQKLNEVFSEDTPLSVDDRIAFVAHSQGGLTSALWFYNAIQKQPTIYGPFAKQTDAIITVGTPFGGSKLAYLGNLAGAMSKYLQKKLIGYNMGPKELKQMAYGSDMIYRFQRKAVVLDQIPLKDFFSMRPLTIAGSAAKSSNPKLQWLHRKALEFAEEYGFGDERYESDIAVAVPNSRIDMIYSQDLTFDYQNGETLSSQTFRMTNYLDRGLVPFKLTEIIHASPDAENIYDMVYIPSICKQNFSACEHPTYGLILEHLANCQDPSMNCDNEALNHLLQISFSPESQERFPQLNPDKGFHGFDLSINLRLPLDYHFLGENLKLTAPQIKSMVEDGEFIKFGRLIKDGALVKEKNDIYELELGRSKELFSIVGKHSFGILDQDPVNHLRLHFTGVVRPNTQNHATNILQDYNVLRRHGFVVKFKVKLPGLKERNIEAIVKPTYTTFVDLQMSPE